MPHDDRAIPLWADHLDFSLVQPAGACRVYSLAPDRFEDLWR